MDMTPPQAPPAIEVPAHAAAAAAYGRLTATSDWLAAQAATLPVAPEAPDRERREAFLAAFDRFWNPPRRAELAVRVADAMRDLAQLGQDDRTLATGSVAMARAAIARPDTAEPSGPVIRELLFGPVVLAGALAVTDGSPDGAALLFTADRGWEAFPDLDALHAAVEHRIRRHLGEGGSLPGTGRRALGNVGTEGISSRLTAGDALAGYVDRAIAVHREKLEEAWLGWAVAEDRAERDTVLADTLTSLLATIPALDMASLLSTRHARLVETLSEERLAGVPDHVATGWRAAADAYATALDAFAPHDVPVKSLANYASDAVAARLTTLGVTLDPADIHVQLDYNRDAAARAQSLQTLFEGTAPARIALLDLAYQNVAAFDPVHLSAFDGEGAPIAALDDRALRSLVRELDLATGYQTYLTTVYRDGEGAAARKEAAMVALAARIHLQAADARLSYYLRNEPRSFRDDHAERGFHWVKAALDSPGTVERRKIDGHDVVVSQLTYRGTSLKDILVFTVRQSGAVPTVVYYTPDAPDGITFREFDDRADAARRFIYQPAFREYLLDRLPVDYATATPGRSERQFAGGRVAHWVFGSEGGADYTWTAEPFDERRVDGNFLDASYETGVQLALRDVVAFSRSASDANWAWLIDWPRRLLLNNLVANAVKGLANAPMHAAQASWRLYDSIKSGDTTQAYLDFTDFYVASLGAAAPGVIGGSARAVVAANFRQGARLVSAAPAKVHTTTFEPRYEAAGVFRRGTPDADGFFVIEGQRYIEQNGKLYAVRRDTTFDTWRLKPHGGNDLSWGPAIQRTESAAWAYNVIGLRGGSGRAVRSTSWRHSTADDWFSHYVDAVERAFPDPFERELVTRTMEAETLGVPSNAQINLIQRARWIEARSNAMSAQGYADWRTHWAGPPQAVAESLVVARPVVPPLPVLSPPFHRIQPSLVPDELYYYGSLPYGTSAFQRQLGLGGYNTDWAHLHGERLGQDLVAIPVTTVRPNAPISDIRAAMGNRSLARWSTFGVRIQPRGLLANGISGPSAELIAIEGATGTRYYLRPLAGENFLRLGTNQQAVPLGREPR
jgi:hypothetical protein